MTQTPTDDLLTVGSEVWTATHATPLSRCAAAPATIIELKADVAFIRRFSGETYWTPRSNAFPTQHDAAQYAEKINRLTRSKPVFGAFDKMTANSEQPPTQPPTDNTNKHQTTAENITKAAQTAELMADDLRQALKTADPVTSLVLLDLIETAARLANKIQALADAGRSE